MRLLRNMTLQPMREGKVDEHQKQVYCDGEHDRKEQNDS